MSGRFEFATSLIVRCSSALSARWPILRCDDESDVAQADNFWEVGSGNLIFGRTRVTMADKEIKLSNEMQLTRPASMWRGYDLIRPRRPTLTPSTQC